MIEQDGKKLEAVSRGTLEQRLLEPLTQGYVPTVPYSALTSPDGLWPQWNFRLDIPAMLIHPMVCTALEYYKSGVAGAEFWGGPTPGAPDPMADMGVPICPENPKVSTYVLEQCNRFWDRGVPKLQRAYDFGWVGGEPLYEDDNGVLAWNGFKEFAPFDTSLLTKARSPVGMRVAHIEGKEPVDLWMGSEDIPAKALWYAHRPIDGSLYGFSQLYGAWRPWRRAAWKDGAETVIDMAAYRFGVAGPVVRYPDEDYVAPLNTPSTTQDSLGQGIRYARDMARMMAEQAKAGASIGLPSTVDDKGNFKWDVVWPSHVIDVGPLTEYAKSLYDQISYGIGVPPELLQASEVGSGYSGRQIPMESFLEGQQKIADALLMLFIEQVLTPLVKWNFGDVKWTVKVKSLLATKKKMNQPAQQPTPGAPPSQMGAAMSLSNPLVTDRIRDIARKIQGKVLA
ncbi:MAG: hypothetical protein K2X38_15390 [Gemmataceae bacterium]|nr:hypothetical protein [Gemmataceae bacterium]